MTAHPHERVSGWTGLNTPASMTALLGGEANPLGAVVQHLRTSPDSVLAALSERFTATALDANLVHARPWLLPFESPWSRILVASCGQWTALVNNGLFGGDGTAPGPALSRELGVECAVASNFPRYGPGHQQTQLEVFAPEGEPPLIYVRSRSANATDGRWAWYESDTAFGFEQCDRYTARRKRDRFDRELLLNYLACLSIPARDETADGRATLLQDRRTYDRRRVTLSEARADFR